MPIILGLLALIGGAYFWAQRARNAAVMTEELAGMASDVMAAARRFGFRRKLNVHPVESLEDANVAMAALGIGFLELGGLPSRENHEALIVALQSECNESHEKAEESVILGRWLITESGGPVTGIDRLARRLYKLRGMQGFAPMMQVLRAVAASQSAGVSAKQSDVLASLSVIFRLRS
jgi:hypothetical protein